MFNSTKKMETCLNKPKPTSAPLPTKFRDEFSVLDGPLTTHTLKHVRENHYRNRGNWHTYFCEQLQHKLKIDGKNEQKLSLHWA